MSYPKAIGPYSAYREAGGLVFLSGALPLDPKSMEFPSQDIQEQTRQALNNIKAILEELGLGMDSVVKTSVLLSDISHFAAMNEVYASFFTAPYPARTAFAVRDLPKGALIEIEVIAQR